uniref:Uncharacterized protein n=1 Tax=Strongyloides stercoralis TaxID=6248 RepID=A0AAF5D8W5_STRER
MDDFVYKEEIDFDKSLINMDSRSKYNKVLSIYKEGRDRSKAFKQGAQLILQFSKTFENFTSSDFNTIIHKSRAQYKAIPSKSDEDKKYMFYLYLELIKKSTRMTKIEFFVNIWNANELNDYVPFFVCFGRIFVEERKYDNLKTVVENAKTGLKEKFNDIEELVGFENLINSHLQHASSKNPTNPHTTIVLSKKYEGESYVEVFISKYRSILYPDIDKEESSCGEKVDYVNEGDPSDVITDLSTNLSETKETATFNTSDLMIVSCADSTIKTAPFLMDDNKKKLEDNSNLETISFCTNISNKLASAFSETLPPQDVSMFDGMTLDKTLPPPEFVTPKAVDLKRSRNDVLISEKKASHEKEFSVFEDENLTRTQVYVDPTGDVDDSIFDDDLIRSPARKKTNYMENHTKLTNNISTVIEEENTMTEDLDEPFIDDNVVDVVEMICQTVSKVPETSVILKSSFKSPDNFKENKYCTNETVNSWNKSNTNIGSINSLEFKGSFTIPTEAEKDNFTPQNQKNAPRPSLMTASTPCRGSEPMQMDECSFYHDLSEIKGDEDEGCVFKPFLEEEENHLFEDENLSVKNSLHAPGNHLLSSPKSVEVKKSPKCSNGLSFSNQSTSHLTEIDSSVDIFQRLNYLYSSVNLSKGIENYIKKQNFLFVPCHWDILTFIKKNVGLSLQHITDHSDVVCYFEFLKDLMLIPFGETFKYTSVAMMYNEIVFIEKVKDTTEPINIKKVKNDFMEKRFKDFCTNKCDENNYEKRSNISFRKQQYITQTREFQGSKSKIKVMFTGEANLIDPTSNSKDNNFMDIRVATEHLLHILSGNEIYNTWSKAYINGNNWIAVGVTKKDLLKHIKFINVSNLESNFPFTVSEIMDFVGQSFESIINACKKYPTKYITIQQCSNSLRVVSEETIKEINFPRPTSDFIQAFPKYSNK